MNLICYIVIKKSGQCHKKKEVIRDGKESEGYDQCQIWEVHQETGKGKGKGYKLQKVGKDVC